MRGELFGGHALRPFRRHDFAEHRMSSIAGTDAATLFCAVESNGIGAEFFAPEGFLEAFAEPFSLCSQICGEAGVPNRSAQAAAARRAA